MQTLSLAYPHAPVSLVPQRLSDRQMWSTVLAVRRHAVADLCARRVELEAIVGVTHRVEINGAGFGAEWDFDHDVRDERDNPVMGTTEFDPREPESVMVSVNGVALAGDAALLRSTAAHELGHVIFDAPGWVAAAAQAGRAEMRAPQAEAAQQPRGDGLSADAAMKQREWRANEFMGRFLAPAGLLRQDYQRKMRRNRYAAPAPSAAPNDLLYELAESYGVTASFIRVRLERYQLIPATPLSAAI